MLFKVTDDSGFLAIIDPDAYRGFVHADWTWDTIQEHFRREMRDRHLLIWGTGMEHCWSIDVSFQPTRASGFREVVGSIDASRGRLLLTNYESLTMAAQFRDVTLPGHTSEGRSCLCHPVSTTAALFSCQTRRVVHHSRNRSVLSMSLRELHHRERFGVSFRGGPPSHALQRPRPSSCRCNRCPA